MTKYKSIAIGATFSKWTVISGAIKIRKKIHFICKCQCGTIKLIESYNLHNAKSHGCLSCVNHRRTHGKSGTGAYRSWEHMKSRCNNNKSTKYNDYGGRGIKVCPEWDSFINFYNDMGDRPEGMELDRIDVNGNYCKENCRWIRPSANMNNRRISINTQRSSKWNPIVNINEFPMCGREFICIYNKQPGLARYINENSSLFFTNTIINFHIKQHELKNITHWRNLPGLPKD